MQKMMHPKRKTMVGASQKLRHTHRTAAGLEDALAVAFDIILELDRCHQYAQNRAKRLTRILQEIREGPYSYNPDRPAGLRVTVRKR